MKNYWIFMLTVGLLTLGASGQTRASTSTSGNASASAGKSGAKANANANANAGANASANNAAAGLGSGTTLQAELTKSLDTRKARAGDEVTAKVTQDVKSDGKVVIRKGSKLMGHVTEARARTKEDSESRLGIAFDRAVLSNGQEVALGAVVQALAPANVAASTVNEGSMGIASSAPSGGGGLGGVVGGATSTVGGTVGSAGNTASSVASSTTGAVGGTVNGAAGVAGQGALSSASHGVVGLQGLTLNSATSGNAQASVISSTTQNVKLDSGTQMVLQIQR